MISEEAASFISAIKEHAGELTAPGAAVIGWYLGRRKTDAEAAKIESEGDATHLDAITRHMEKLIDGYERRIEDLTLEINNLRGEIVALRQALDQRPRPPAA